MPPRSEPSRNRMTALLEDVLGCKWSLSVLRAVHAGTTRPGQLEKAIPGISTKVLNERLRKLVAHDIFARTEFPEVPPHVEYGFTELGRKFFAVLEQIESLEREYVRQDTPDAIATGLQDQDRSRLKS